MKLLTILCKNLSFVKITLTAIIFNLFDVYFVKKCYISNDSLDDIEIKDKKIRKINQFRNNFKFLLFGYIINSLWFLFILENLNFHIFDNCKIFNNNYKKFIFLFFYSFGGISIKLLFF